MLIYFSDGYAQIHKNRPNRCALTLTLVALRERGAYIGAPKYVRAKHTTDEARVYGEIVYLSSSRMCKGKTESQKHSRRAHSARGE